MSSGLTNAPTAFMDLMNRVFRPIMDQFVVIFIDDILIYLKSIEEHVYHLKTVLQTLREQHIYAKFSKYDFWLESVPFLGYIVSKDGIQIDPQKIKIVSEWSKLTSVIEIRSFLGLIGYYRRFVQDFLRITAPMTRLTQKNVKFMWSEACENSFQLLKEKLTIALVLTLPNGEDKFTVYCNASRIGLGCVLIQNDSVVAYASR